ncbi:uncharacterized protein LOC106171127 [Lingula anatina]|uniref:Uncharacterized protein LOC106171127 n=1 Tax=Lingula anatina TaxID=7574 RepID=A0A1S3JA35_LINAN|nr:uncharacterized protein LOC106171127 [Lingula anatina]|eukprot:XP_013406739.1 uncharacterized protein LOC106171127 [Lingula anatina]
MATTVKKVFVGLMFIFFTVDFGAPQAVSKDVYQCPRRQPTFRSGHSVPHPGTCNRYIICSYGTAFSFKCQKGLVYEPRSKSCVFPWQYECIPKTTRRQKKTTAASRTKSIPITSLRHHCRSSSFMLNKTACSRTVTLNLSCPDLHYY